MGEVNSCRNIGVKVNSCLKFSKVFPDWTTHPKAHRIKINRLRIGQTNLDYDFLISKLLQSRCERCTHLSCLHLCRSTISGGSQFDINSTADKLNI